MSTIIYGINAPTVEMFDNNGLSALVNKAAQRSYADRGYSYNVPTIAVTGTAIASGVAEADIATGGETLILTLTNGTWAATTPFNALRASLTTLLVGDQPTAAGGWAQAVTPNFVVTNVVRTSATICTITLPASSGYSIAADETVTISIPGGMVLYSNGFPVNADTTIAGVAASSALRPTPYTFVITAS